MDMRQWGQQFLKPEELLEHGPLKEQANCESSAPPTTTIPQADTRVQER